MNGGSPEQSLIGEPEWGGRQRNQLLLGPNPAWATHAVSGRRLEWSVFPAAGRTFPLRDPTSGRKRRFRHGRTHGRQGAQRSAGERVALFEEPFLFREPRLVLPLKTFVVG